jgi:hypothetical protein
MLFFITVFATDRGAYLECLLTRIEMKLFIEVLKAL